LAPLTQWGELLEGGTLKFMLCSLKKVLCNELAEGERSRGVG
jgi:hypothetical protein